MPVLEVTIKNQIISLIKNNKETDSDKAIEFFANGMSKIIKGAILSATVTVPSGIPVATAGSPTNQVGATTAPSIASVK